MELDLVALLAGAVLGGVAGFLIAKIWQQDPEPLHYRIQELDDDRRELQEQLRSEQQESRQTQQQLQETIGSLREERSALSVERDNLKKALEEQKEELEELEQRLRDKFENLANDLLEKKSRKFTEQNQERLNELLKPLGERLEKFQKEVRETREKSVKENTQLQEQIKQLASLNEQMSEDAQSLVRALEGQSKTQGDWGEMILERVLEESGLQKGREYETQQSYTRDDGSRIQPDVVVHLPQERCLVIDSKVSISAYKRYVDADDEADRKKARKQHLQSVRNHVADLSKKSYHRLPGGISPEFVLMFIPLEPAFALALQQDDGLYSEAFRNNVVLVSPTTLLATLRAVSNIWQYERQIQNAQEIAERGGQLYDKFVLFAEALTEVGQRLDQAKRSYNKAVGRLSTGHGNLVRQAEMLRDLGASASKELPAELKSEKDPSGQSGSAA